MSISVQRLRRWMLAAGGLLVLVIVGYLALAHVRQVLIRKAFPNLQKMAMNVLRTGGAMSHTEYGPDGKPIFTILAKAEEQLKDGTFALHDASVILYGRKQDRTDRIEGSEFIYDPKSGEIRAQDEVHIDLQASAVKPGAGAGKDGHGAIGTAKDGGENSDDQMVHVKTRGLVYLRRLGVAATEQPVEFAIKGMTGNAVGAEYSTDTGVLVLQSQVKVMGVRGGKPVELTASRAELNRDGGHAALTGVQYMEIEGSTKPSLHVSAKNAVVTMRADGSPDHVDAGGNVTLDPGGGRKLHAEKMTVDLDAEGNAKALHAFGGLHYVDDEPLRKGNGEAAEAQVAFDAAGRPSHLTAIGPVHMTQRRRTAADAAWTTQTMSANEAEAAFAPLSGGDAAGVPAFAWKGEALELREASAQGGARLTMESLPAKKGGAVTTTAMAADHMESVFPSTNGGVAKMHGEGHTEFRQTDTGGGEQASHGDAMDVVFRMKDQAKKAAVAADVQGPQSMIVSAVQQGHVTMTSSPAKKAGDAKQQAPGHGTANRVEYDGAQDRLTMAGLAMWSSEGSTFWADRIVTERATGDTEAQGGVKASVVKDDAAASATTEVTHFIADHARVVHATQLADFYGSAATPARMWQDGSQVEAPVLEVEMDKTKQRLTAHGDGAGAQVHAVFADARPPAPGAKKIPKVMRVASHEMTYSGVSQSGVFSGDVQAMSGDGTIYGRRAEFWLLPAAAKSGDAKPGAPQKQMVAAGGFSDGSVDHILMTGDIRVEQPGLHGTGEQLIYTADNDQYVLTGSPAKVVKARSATEGASLIFRYGDGSVEISGGTGAGRVRTETQVKQKVRQ